MKTVSMQLPTEYGAFQFLVWPGARGQELVALVTPTLDASKEVLVRIHSECLTGDTFESHTCDCGPQKELALHEIAKHGNGIFIYHRQEGRNMGLYKKVQAYNLMKKGLDTHEANLELAGHPDGREYGDVLTALDVLLKGTKSDIRLLTNNPYKKLFLERYGFRVTVQKLAVEGTLHNAEYMDTKRSKFLHGAVHDSYVGVTLLRNDLPHVAAIKKVIESLDLKEGGRTINIGIGIFPEHGDARDAAFAREINEFTRTLTLPRVQVVIHVDWPKKRSGHRELRQFLEMLSFPYALQFRLRDAGAVDVELLEVFHAEQVIFQLKSSQLSLVENSDFREYFSRPHHAVLLDDSWGTGELADMDSMKRTVLACIRHGMSRIGVAGGFSAQRIPFVFGLEDYFKIPISVDAESRLRENGCISIPKMEAYLRAALTPQT